MNRRSMHAPIFLPLALVAIAACSGAEGAPGAPGAKGDPGPMGSAGPAGSSSSSTTPPSVTASISDVSPLKVFLARKTDVSIGGYGTNWSSTTTVDFGAGVKVDKIAVASPTALVASVTVDKGAALGAHDVKVTDGATVSTFAGAFHVASPITLLSVDGTVAQGSLTIVHVKNEDLTTPFDTSADANGNFLGLALGDTPGLSIVVNNASIVATDFILLADVDAAAGDVNLNLKSGAGATAIDNPYPKAFTIAARTATALGTTPATGTVAKPYDSALFKLTPAAKLQLVDLDLGVTSPPSGASPRAYLLPKSGKFADLIGSVRSGTTKTFVTKTADPLYLVFWDNTGAKGYGFTLKNKGTDATLVTKAADVTTLAKAQSITTMPAVLAPITVPSTTDKAYFKVTIAAADKGKSLHVASYGMAPDSDPQTAVDIDILDSKGVSILAGGPGSDVTSDPFTAAGTYYVLITPAAAGLFSAGFDPAHNKYEAFMRLE